MKLYSYSPESGTLAAWFLLPCLICNSTHATNEAQSNESVVSSSSLEGGLRGVSTVPVGRELNAPPGGTSGGDGKNGKVDICHLPPGNPTNVQTISISTSALNTHLTQHGDLKGTCELQCEEACAQDVDFCTTHASIDQGGKCKCLDHPMPTYTLQEEDEQCCSPYGNIISSQGCCPIGVEACCGLSLAECLEATNPGTLCEDPFQFHESIVGVDGGKYVLTNANVIPSYTVDMDDASGSIVAGTLYDVASHDGLSMEIEILEVIVDTEELFTYMNATLLSMEEKASIKDLLPSGDGELEYKVNGLLHEYMSSLPKEVTKAMIALNATASIAVGKTGGESFLGLIVSYTNPIGSKAWQLFYLGCIPETGSSWTPTVDPLDPSFRCHRRSQKDKNDAMRQCELGNMTMEFVDDDPQCEEDAITTCIEELTTVQSTYEDIAIAAAAAYNLIVQERAPLQKTKSILEAVFGPPASCATTYMDPFNVVACASANIVLNSEYQFFQHTMIMQHLGEAAVDLAKRHRNHGVIHNLDLLTTTIQECWTCEMIGCPEGCDEACNDGDLCTTNFCDITQNCQCVTEVAVTCEEDQACDSFTGLCQEIQKVVPCVAVIDEWDNRDYSSEWAQFRALYPFRSFCLLVPRSSIQTLPSGFDADTVGNPDGIDRTIVASVNRDNGNPAQASDWFNACNFGSLSSSTINFVGFFLDTSGSMTEATVQASLDKFINDLANAGFANAQVFNGDEEWIDPFLTTLVP